MSARTDTPGTLPAPDRPRLDYLHGLRGLAALLVAVGHCLQLADTQTGQAIPWLRPLDYLSSLAVPTFIVLSGYCLALPVLRRPDLRLEGGALGFLRRRAARILPAYYLALAVSLLVGLTLARTASAQEVLHPGPALLGPLLLLHDVYGSAPFWNRPLWSLPIEWHIYFLAPALFWLWRRYGVARATPLALLVLVLVQGPASWLHLDRLWLPFYMLFALGAATAALVTKLAPQIAAARRGTFRARERFAALALGGFVLWFGCFASGGYMAYAAPARLPFAFTAWGLWVCVLLGSLGAGAGRGPLARLLGARPLRALGEMSYSLYLLHWAPVSTFALLVGGLGAPVRGSAVLFFLLLGASALPTSLLLARLSYQIAERPYLRTSARVRTQPSTPLPSLELESALPASL